MSKKEDRLSLAAPMKADDKVLFVGQRTNYLHVFSRKTCSAKALSHGFCRCGYVAGGRVSGVDLNELFKDIVRGLMFR
jgi:hypothetical protein